MKRKIAKWQKPLTKAERTHLKSMHVTTRKAFVELNDYHNRERLKVAATEPCYVCKGVALKLGLSVASRNMVIAVPKLDVVVEAELVEVKEPVVDRVFDMPLIYLIILISTIGFGAASAVVYLKGW